LLFAVAACATIFSSSQGAQASGFATARFGGEHGNVTEQNPTALYYNVGALGFSEGIHLMVDGSLALRSVTWVHPPASSDPPEPPGAEGANAGQAEVFNVFGAPALGASARFGDWAVGAGLFVPFGGRAKWSQNPSFVGHSTYPLAADGVQRWHSIRGAITFLYVSLGAAYRIGPLSLGVSGNLISGSVQSLRAYNPSADTLPDSDQEGRADLDFHHIVGSFGARALELRLRARAECGCAGRLHGFLRLHELELHVEREHDVRVVAADVPHCVDFGQRHGRFTLSAAARENGVVPRRPQGRHVRRLVLAREPPRTGTEAAHGDDHEQDEEGALQRSSRVR
jgi:hypothetical protein